MMISALISIIVASTAVLAAPATEKTISKCGLCKALVQDFDAIMGNTVDVCNDNFADLKSIMTCKNLVKQISIVRRGDSAELLSQDLDQSEYICSRIQVCPTVAINSETKENEDIVFQNFDPEILKSPATEPQPENNEEEEKSGPEISKCGLCQDIVQDFTAHASADAETPYAYPCNDIFSDLKSIMMCKNIFQQVGIVYRGDQAELIDSSVNPVDYICSRIQVCPKAIEKPIPRQEDDETTKVDDVTMESDSLVMQVVTVTKESIHRGTNGDEQKVFVIDRETVSTVHHYHYVNNPWFWFGMNFYLRMVLCLVSLGLFIAILRHFTTSNTKSSGCVYTWMRDTIKYHKNGKKGHYKQVPTTAV